MINAYKGYAYDDLLLVPKHSKIKSRSDIDLSVDLGKDIKLRVPIISANMKTITGVKLARAIADYGGMAIMHRFFDTPADNKMEWARAVGLEGDWKTSVCNTKTEELTHQIGMSIGVSESDYKLVDKLPPLLKIICIDVAHGHHDNAMNMLKHIKSKNTDKLIIVGNIATVAAAKDLYRDGADVLKVNIGSGSTCSTRIETGNGVPAMTALSNIWDWLPAKNRPTVIADGGLKKAGDIVKALCFSDSVMLGSLLAGTEEANADTVTKNGNLYKLYAGSSTHKKSHIEGVAGLVPFKGPVKQVLTNLEEGIRSGLSYQGAMNLKELQEDPEFMEISSAGLAESHPHVDFRK